MVGARRRLVVHASATCVRDTDGKMTAAGCARVFCLIAWGVTGRSTLSPLRFSAVFGSTHAGVSLPHRHTLLLADAGLRVLVALALDSCFGPTSRVSRFCNIEFYGMIVSVLLREVSAALALFAAADCGPSHAFTGQCFPGPLTACMKEHIVSSKMKVLLTKDVEKLGHAGDIKEVSGGYGRNYLLPQGFAVLATRGQVKQAEERAAAQNKRSQAARKDAEALAARINGQTLRFTARVGELDRLYGSVTNSDIADKIKETLGIEVDRRKIDLEDPIKRIGIYPVSINLVSGVTPIVNVVVEGEEGAIQLPADELPPDPETAE